jgi:hypothetical protein
MAAAPAEIEPSRCLALDSLPGRPKLRPRRSSSTSRIGGALTDPNHRAQCRVAGVRCRSRPRCRSAEPPGSRCRRLGLVFRSRRRGRIARHDRCGPAFSVLPPATYREDCDDTALGEIGAGELDQHKQILHPQRATLARQRHKRIRVGRVRPAPRQRALRPLLVEKEHPVLAPALPPARTPGPATDGTDALRERVAAQARNRA